MSDKLLKMNTVLLLSVFFFLAFGAQPFIIGSTLTPIQKSPVNLDDVTIQITSENIIVRKNDIEISISISREGYNHLQLIYSYEKISVIADYFITKLDNKEYHTVVQINGKELLASNLPVNILEPVMDCNTVSSKLSAMKVLPKWDNLYYYKGLPYPHPDRNTYGFIAAQMWTGLGTKLTHNQIDSRIAPQLCSGGLGIIGAAIGAAIGAGAGPAGAALGAVIGGVIGLIIGILSAVILLDESSAMWWWGSHAFNYWLGINAPWLVFQPTLIQTYYITNAMLTYGYIRLGSVTYLDAVGAGIP